MRKIKRVLGRIIRLPARFLRAVDRKIQRGFTKIFRALYKVAFLRPVTKKTYRFVHYHHRITAAFLCLLFIVGVAVPALQPYLRNQRYNLNEQAQGLLGEADKDLAKKITFDEKNQLYQFNKDGKKTPTTSGNPLAKLQSQVGGGGEKDSQLYSVDVPKSLSQGVTYYDNQMELSFKLTPQFNTMPGEQRDGHLVYPLNGTKGQLAYTVGSSGMKENVVLYKNPGNEFTMSYKLDLPKSLEARLIPETGEVGIYSADPALFGNISYGSSDDQAKVEAARNNSQKNYLTFKIPAPVVLGVGETSQKSIAAVESHFELSGDTLRVVTKGLDKAEYPLSIDPSVSVDSTSDFQTGNLEDNNQYVDSGDLKRGSATGGGLNSASGTYTTVNLTTNTGVAYTDVIVYNGYMYIVGGWDGGGVVNKVRYAALNSNGSFGTWQEGTDIPVAIADHQAVAYNGYMYILGGGDDDFNLYTNLYYAPIYADGTMGSWNTTNKFTGDRYDLTAVAYNGYMYIAGGNNGSSYLSDVQYAPIKANGTLGTWQSTAALEGPIAGHSMVAYNGYMYRIGGDYTETVSYAPIKANGELGAWTFTTSLPYVRYDAGVTVYNGYLYLAGGSAVSGSGGSGSGGKFSGVFYAQIRANGTIGAWTETTTLPSPRNNTAAVAYNGFFYLISGDTGPGPLDQIIYTPIDPAGTTTTYTAATALPVGRERHASVAYNGFLYVLGGRQSGSTYYNVTYYARICTGYNSGVGGCGSTAGALGTWATTTNAFTAARAGHTAVAYNGYIYIIGGQKPSTANNTTCRSTGGSGLLCNDIQKALICTGSNNGVSGCNSTAGNVGTWTTSGVTPFTTARAGHTSVVYNGYLYVIGGDTGSQNNTIQYASIDLTNGNIGSWTTSGNTFTTARSLHASVVYAGYVYVIGGYNGTTQLADTQKALICTGSNNGVSGCGATAGAIGSWASATGTNFTTARDSLGAVAYNGYLYILGGSTGSQQSIVQYAPIDPTNGTIGTWVSNISLSAARSAHASVVYNGFIYNTAGFSGGYSTSVNYARINNDSSGLVGSWTSTTALTNPSTGVAAGRYSFASIAYNGYLYSIGGDISGVGYSNSIQYALICTGGNNGVGGCGSTAGALGSWVTAANSFTTARAGLAVAVYNGNLYISGGRKASTGTVCSGTSSDYCSDVQYAPLNSDGSIGSWNPATTTGFTTPRQEHDIAAYGGYLYILGGDSGSGYLNDIQYAAINSNGTIGGWTTAANTFATTRGGHVAMAYNGYLYVSGGYTGGALLDDVQYAPINSGGAPGAWNYTTSLNSPRESLAGVVQDGFMYISGGIANGSSYQNDVQYAPIYSNGTVGAWVHTTSFSTVRQDHTMAAYNGYMYVLGGETTGGSLRSDVQYARIEAMPKKALYSKLIDLGTNSKITGISYNGTLPGGNRAIQYRIAGSDGVFGAKASAVSPLSCSDSIGQYIQLTVTLDDGNIATFPSINNATVSSITVDSSPVGTPPDKRLRHGAWFYNEQLQPFDTGGAQCS